MASRRDQLQSYQFLNQRVISALVMRETDPAQSPLRRGVGALFGGAMVLVIIAAGFGVYGLITKIGSPGWKTDGTVVVEKETGASYLYENKLLHPMLNHTSALLASRHAPPNIVRVARKGLVDVPRGQVWGIPKAPTSIPGPDTLLPGAWAMCASPTVDASGNPISVTGLLVGDDVKSSQPLDLDSALLVRADTTTYLVWHGHRFEVRRPDVVLPSLFRDPRRVIPVGRAWLNGLLEGLPLEPITVPRASTPSRLLTGHRVGDLLVATTGSGPQYYLLFDDGVAPITETQQRIYAGATGASASPTTIAQVNQVGTSRQLPAAEQDVQPPEAPPKLRQLDVDNVICAFSTFSGTPVLTFGGTIPDDVSGNPTAGATQQGAPLADVVIVPSGKAALVRVMLSAPGGGAGGSATGGFALVTDAGLRYPLSADALTYLGLDARKAVGIPAALVNSIPAGPSLDPTAARSPVDMTQSVIGN